MNCDAVRDAAPELVLGVLDGVERAEVVGHLSACVPCRAEVARLTEAVEALGALAPPMAPSRGFEPGVLEMMGFVATPLPVNSFRRRTALAVLSAAAIVIVLALVLMRGNDHAAFAASAPMIGRQGQTAGQSVGTVSVEGTDDARVTASVSYYGERGDFRLEAVDHDGRVTALGALAWDDGRYEWTGTVARAAREFAGFRVVSADGAVFCEGSLSD